MITEKEKPMEKQKQIQISEQVFYDACLVCYSVLNDEIRACLRKDELEIVERLETALNAKIDKMINHTIYTMSKNQNATAEERELARQKYLDRKGIHKNFRW